ncbi:GNAT family N-acetyltransferase [Nocardioides aurantiacus]|uniref:GNAT family N-acetyltransferase n=1 Tax=Nocardioides aurantiacus TaxID=86796 RepID=UPI00403F8839
MAASEVTRNESELRWEIRVNDRLVGFAAYQRTPDEIVFTHTEIDDGHEGEGLGGALVRAALDDVRAEGLKALPICPFVQAFLDRHEDYRDLDSRR